MKFRKAKLVVLSFVLILTMIIGTVSVSAATDELHETVVTYGDAELKVKVTVKDQNSNKIEDAKVTLYYVDFGREVEAAAADTWNDILAILGEDENSIFKWAVENSRSMSCFTNEDGVATYLLDSGVDWVYGYVVASTPDYQGTKGNISYFSGRMGILIPGFKSKSFTVRVDVNAPENPTDPTTPTDPADPTTPADPTNPADPSDPSNPGNPDLPILPGGNGDDDGNGGDNGGNEVILPVDPGSEVVIPGGNSQPDDNGNGQGGQGQGGQGGNTDTGKEPEAGGNEGGAIEEPVQSQPSVLPPKAGDIEDVIDDIEMTETAMGDVKDTASKEQPKGTTPKDTTPKEQPKSTDDTMDIGGNSTPAGDTDDDVIVGGSVVGNNDVITGNDSVLDVADNTPKGDADADVPAEPVDKGTYQLIAKTEINENGNEQAQRGFFVNMFADGKLLRSWWLYAIIAVLLGGGIGAYVIKKKK